MFYMKVVKGVNHKCSHDNEKNFFFYFFNSDVCVCVCVCVCVYMMEIH